MKTKTRLTEREKREVVYHERCRDICKHFKWILVGSSIDAGFSCFYKSGSGYAAHFDSVQMEMVEKLMMLPFFFLIMRGANSWQQ